MEQAEQAKQHFETGKILRSRGLYRAACAEFEKADAIAPAGADLLVEWGQALADKDDHAGAILKYEQAAKLEPGRVDAYTGWADSLRALDRFDEAARKYAEAASLDTQDAGAYLGQAAALAGQEEWGEAVGVYRKLIEVDPAVDVYWDLSLALEHLGPDEKGSATKELDALLTSDARYAKALTLWGAALAAQEKYDEAAVRFQMASTVDRAYAPAYAGWGNALMYRKQPAEAIDRYLEALTLDPSDGWLIGEVDKALADLDGSQSVAVRQTVDRLLKSDARYATVLCGWADRLAGKELYPEAILRYGDALELDPRLFDAFLGWGNALAAQGKHDEAIERFRQASALDPKRGGPFVRWAHVLASQQRHTDAAGQYQQAIEVDLESVDFDDLLELLEKLDAASSSRILAALESALARSGTTERYVAWGDALAAKGRDAEAVTRYEQALQRDAEDRAVWVSARDAQTRLRRYSSAAESCDRISKLDPYDRQNYLTCADALHRERRYEEAIERYKKAVELDPGDADADVAWGWTLYGQQKYDEAIGQFQRAIGKEPGLASAHHNWGLALAAQRKYDEAAEHYRKALELDPTDANPCLDWGNVLDEQGRRQEAIEVCERATTIKEDFAYAHHNIAYYLWAQGDYHNGLKAWDRAGEVYERTRTAQKQEQNAEFFQYYGAVLYEQLRSPDKAEEVLKEGLALDPDHTGLLAVLLEVYLERHEEPAKGDGADAWKPSTYARARECFRRAEGILKRRLDRFDDSWTLLELGDLYLKMGEYEDAKTYLDRALKKDPDSPAPHGSLGVVCSRKEDFRQAMQHFEAARRRAHNDLNIWSNLAEVYLKLNPKELRQIQKAEAEFRRILKIAPDHIDSRIGLGEAYTAMAEAGDKEFYRVAIEHYDAAVKLADSGRGSKRLRTRELAAVLYSRGYARVQLYEASRPFGDEALLQDALADFSRCARLDCDHFKAALAKDKLDKRLSKRGRRWFEEKVAPWVVAAPAGFVFIVAQLTFIFKLFQTQKQIDLTSYIALTFGSLMFIVVGLFLPEIQKLKGGGIELERGAMTQISPSGSLGISK